MVASPAHMVASPAHMVTSPAHMVTSPAHMVARSWLMWLLKNRGRSFLFQMPGLEILQLLH